jgi:aminopeptidase N
MISLLSTFMSDDAGVVAEARERFGKFLVDAADMKALPSDMRSAVFSIVLKAGGEEEYRQVKGYFETATDNAEKKHVLNSIGSTPDAKLKMEALEWTCSGEVKLQDFFYTLGSIHRSNKVGMEMTWKYFQDNFDKLKAFVGKASASLFDAVIVYCCGGFASLEKAKEIEDFFEKNPMPQNARKIAQMLESIKTNAKFLKQVQEELGQDRSWVAV